VQSNDSKSKIETKKKIVPKLDFENLDLSRSKRRRQTVIQVEDIEDKAHSSERRDQVDSLREHPFIHYKTAP